MSFIKIGLGFLARRKLRTVLTIIAVSLGVGILVGVNVTADSIDVAINDQINAKLGNLDLVIRANSSVEGGWFRYYDAEKILKNVPHVSSFVPRIVKSAPNYPYPNSNTSWTTPVIALDTSSDTERTFGKCNITDALDPALINTSRLEDLFVEYSDLQLPVVISSGYASSFNLKPGDSIYIYPEDPDFFGGMDPENTTTWFKATIIGIISDISEGIQDFMPPARIWELYPPSKAIYMDINTAWSYIFNLHKNYVNMVFVHADSSANIGQIEDYFAQHRHPDVFPGGAFTQNIKILFIEGIMQINFLMRGIFSIFSGISLLVCAIIIKNLLEMSKEEQTYEIGIMRSIGVTKAKIFEMYIFQILVISVTGSIIGLGLGYILSFFFMNSYIDAAAAVGTDFGNVQIVPQMSPLTVTVGMASGVIISLIFGFFPARSAANVDPLEALRSTHQRPRESLLVRTIKKTGNISISIGFIVAGVAAIAWAFSGLFLLDIVDPTIIGVLFAGVILLVIGVVFVAAFIFPYIVPLFGYLLSPFLGKVRPIAVRSLKRYTGQSKNTFAMLAIGICMMITVGTIMYSAYAGAYPGGKTITGGDIRVGDIYRGHVPKDPTTDELGGLPSVKVVVPIRFSLGFEGITKIINLKTGQTFGGIKDYFFGSIRESFHLGIIEPNIYAELHSSDSIVKFDRDSGDLSAVMKELEEPYTVIIQDRLARRLGGVKKGDWVKIRFDGFEAVFKVVGIFGILPGFYWTYYSTDNAFDKQFAGAISWNTYVRLIDDNIGKADIIAKSKAVPPEEYRDALPDQRLWGYVSVPIDYRTLEDLMYSTGAVVNSTRRVMSPFFGVPSFSWRTNFSVEEFENLEVNSEEFNRSLAEQNVMWWEPGAIKTGWNNMLSRAEIIDPNTDYGFGNTTITSTLPSIPAPYNETVEGIMKWSAENMPDVNICIVNEIYVNYNISTGKFDYVKRFEPGETLRIFFNETVYADFLIAGTTNSHYYYSYVDRLNKHHGDTMVLNFKTMSFNPYTANGSDWNYYFEVMDTDPNIIFIPNTARAFSEGFTSTMIPYMLSNYLNNFNGTFTVNDTTGTDNETQFYLNLSSTPFVYWWLNQTLGNMYVFNGTVSNGTITTDFWNGTYYINGTTFVLNGGSFSVGGNTVESNITLNLTEADRQLLEAIVNGTIPLTSENFTTAVIFDLNDSMTAEEIKQFITQMEAICKKIPTLQNISFFAPKLFMLNDSGLFNVYYLIGAVNKNSIDSAYLEVKNYYLSHGLPWNDNWVQRSTDMEKQVGGILGLIVNMFFGVLSFALIVSLLGLSISTIISVRRRYAEIGTLRTLGFSNGQILRMIIGEEVITALYGIIVGNIAGLLIAYLIISNLPFMIFLPIVFTPPIPMIVYGVILLVIAAVCVSFIPAVSATRIDIAEAIRTKGE